MLKLSIEELTAINLILSFVSTQELLNAAMIGFVDTKEESTTVDKEKSDLCWKILQSLK